MFVLNKQFMKRIHILTVTALLCFPVGCLNVTLKRDAWSSSWLWVCTY